MTREEAIKLLHEISEQCCETANILCTEDADKRCDALDMAIEALSEDISEDGTLKVKVKDGSKVNRVLVLGDNNFGGLYYPDRGAYMGGDNGKQKHL